jgi:hypothetical protein
VGSFGAAVHSFSAPAEEAPPIHGPTHGRHQDAPSFTSAPSTSS